MKSSILFYSLFFGATFGVGQALAAAKETPAVKSSSASTLLPAPSTSGSKTLYIDVSKTFEASKKAQDDFAQFQKAKDKAESDLAKIQKEGDKLVDQYKEIYVKIESPDSQFSEEAKKKFASDAVSLEVQIQNKQNELNQLQQQINRSLGGLHDQMMATFEGNVRTIAEALRKEKGAIEVVNTNGPVILAYDPALDVTEEVIQRINALYPALSTAASLKDTPTPKEGAGKAPSEKSKK
jgi:Skp family chaperone for outer membrane proteins